MESVIPNYGASLLCIDTARIAGPFLGLPGAQRMAVA